jgi:uncharacterized protein (UPF0212 family)
MPAGQSQTTWFPELKQLLHDNWNKDLTIPEQFELVAVLNNKLNQIRTEGNIQPHMMWCPKCQERHRSRFIAVSITSVYFALKRFDLCTENEFKELRKKWRVYSKEKNLDTYGKVIDKTTIEHSTKAE